MENEDDVGVWYAVFIIVVALGTALILAHFTGIVDHFINSYN
jgi:hypothetical protein